MGSEDISQHAQSHADDAGIAAELRRLAARVDQLEREVAVLRAGDASARAAAPPPPPPPMPVAAPPPAMPELAAVVPAVSSEVVEPTGRAKAPSLENRLGAQIFNRIGIIALLCAAAIGLKLAIDNQWIGPVERILIGLVAGAGVILWSERFRKKGFALFSYSLKAIGTGVLYLTLWAAFQIYHLLPDSAALAGMVLVTVWNAYMAWAQDAEILAAYALAGGLSTPLLLSTGGNHEAFLFTYLLAIDVATVVLVRLKSWARLLLAAFPATVIYFVGWYSRFYSETAFAVTVIFICLFFIVFVSVSLARASEGEVATTTVRRRLHDAVREILLPLGNAAFVSLALYSVMQDSDRHWFLPWLMLILAAAYLILTHLSQGVVVAAMHLSLAVVFLTIAIPLKASGHWITVAWLVEGAALLWASSRVSAQAVTPQHRSSASILRWLSAGAFVLGLGALIATGFWFGDGAEPKLLDRHFLTALVGVAAFAGAGWISLKARLGEHGLRNEFTRYALAAVTAVCGIAVLISLREVTASLGQSQPSRAFMNVEFAMALTGIAILAVVGRVARSIALEDGTTLQWVQIAAAVVIVVNLIAVLSGVREVRALWPPSAGGEMDLQRSLAVSGFLMLYGAMLLAVGFWRRSAFIRWQALILLIFSIGKTFLYDTRNLSQGYRFISFLALGALLMTISFAYQKDWLALRDSPASDASQGAEK